MRFAKAIVPLLALSIAACAGDADEGEDMEVATTDSMAMEPAAMPEPGLDQPPGGLGQTAQLSPLDGSGVEGEVTVADRGEQSEVMVRLTGAPANGEHPGHIHSGSCSAIGGVIQPLDPISTDSTGVGTMTANAEIEPAALMDGQHIVVYHGTGGRPVTCAEIPGMTM